MKIIKNNKKKIYFLVIFTFGVFFRFYNLNFEDFWVDEVATFWVSNPFIEINQSFKNNNSLELHPFFYNFIIRNYFIIFNYSVDNSRYISAVFSSLSILSFSYLSWYISKNKTYLLAAFLLSFNIFLISYAQEFRAYSFLFFFIVLTIIFFFRFVKQKKLSDLFFFNLSILVSIFTHPFALILLFSVIIYFILLFIRKGIFFKKLIFSIIIISSISLIYYYFYFMNLVPNQSQSFFFLNNLELKFFTNLYFSKFFGSRILGLFFLILFLFLIIKFFSKISELKESSFLFIFFLMSYLVPIIYGYIFHPIIQAKYIIFVIIPILLIISEYTQLLKKKIKFYLISLILILTLGNLFTEQTVKQFFNKRMHFKPEILNSIKFIESSENNFFTFKIDTYDNVRKPWKSAMENYVMVLIKSNHLKVNYINNHKDVKDLFWELCLHDLNYNGCGNDQFKLIKKVEFNRLTISLFSKSLIRS